MLVDGTRIQLCGTLAARLGDRRIDPELPGRQGRLLFAYLVLNRRRACTRDELLDALWPADGPSEAGTAVRALLSKLRRVLPDGALERGGEVQLVLTAAAFVDIEHARGAIHRAESALAQQQFGRAWGACQGPLFTARRGFFADHDAPWVDEIRHELDSLHLRALECYGEASLGVGGTELAAAERSGRELIKLAPFRESGYRQLIRALVSTGNGAEAVRVYEELRCRLRDELGVAPSAETRELHERVLAERE